MCTVYGNDGCSVWNVSRDAKLSRIGFQRTSFSWAPRTPRTPSSTQCSPPLGTARVDLPSCRNPWLVFPRVSSHNGDWGNRWKPLHLQYYECYKLGVGGTFPGEIRSIMWTKCLTSPSSGCSAREQPLLGDGPHFLRRKYGPKTHQQSLLIQKKNTEIFEIATVILTAFSLV